VVLNIYKEKPVANATGFVFVYGFIVI